MEQQHPVQSISKAQARRFLLNHQYLYPPQQIKGRDGILSFIQHVGCIQFDPINVVGRNPDLVLQSRIKEYRPGQLESLLYEDRQLLDGWDKMQSIFHVSDWPYFSRHRATMRKRYDDPPTPAINVVPEILQTLRQLGPLSSIDFKHTEQLDWSWGRSSTTAKAALDILYAMGDIGIHHKVGTRRVFDLIDRLVPPEMLSEPDPNPLEENYQEWHVLRRVGGLGLAQASASEYWGGVLGVKRKDQRETILSRLIEKGEILPVRIEGIKGRNFYMRTRDADTLERVKKKSRARRRAVIVAPLDNLLWDRNLARWVFEFDYVWEVYKPIPQRIYGYYVLPILYGDRFIARFEPAFDRSSHEMFVKNWWWEEGIESDEKMERALIDCFVEFKHFLGADKVGRSDGCKEDKRLDWISSLTMSIL
jgi:uncharacterized protein YcaQ